MKKLGVSIISIMLALLLYVFSTEQDMYNNIVPKMVAFVVCIYSIWFFMYQQKTIYKGIWYKPSNIFLICYIIVSFQYVFDLVIGYKTYADFYIGSSVNKLSITCLLGLISFIVGYMLTSDRGSRNDRRYSSSVISYKFLIILQLFFFTRWILTVNILSLLAGHSYFEDLSGTSAAFYENLFYDVTVAILIIIVNNCKVKGLDTPKSFFREGNIFVWLTIGAYCLIRLVSGDRGPCLYMILAVFFSLTIIAKNYIKVSRIIVLALAGMFILNLVGIARSLSLDMSFSDRISSAFTDFSSSDDARFSEKTILPMTEELAMSSRCNQIAISTIDSQSEELHGGKYAFYQFIQCFPFVPSFLHNTLKIPADELSANIKMTDIYYGRHDFAQIGTTVVADAYFDLGVFGVVLMLLLCGFVFRKVDYGICMCPPNHWFFLAIYLLFASMAVYIPRSTLIFQLKQLIPICALYFINYHFFKRL